MTNNNRQRRSLKVIATIVSFVAIAAGCSNAPDRERQGAPSSSAPVTISPDLPESVENQPSGDDIQAARNGSKSFYLSAFVGKPLSVLYSSLNLPQSPPPALRSERPTELHVVPGSAEAKAPAVPADRLVVTAALVQAGTLHIGVAPRDNAAADIQRLVELSGAQSLEKRVPFPSDLDRAISRTQNQLADRLTASGQQLTPVITIAVPKGA